MNRSHTAFHDALTGRTSSPCGTFPVHSRTPRPLRVDAHGTALLGLSSPDTLLVDAWEPPLPIEGARDAITQLHAMQSPAQRPVHSGPRMAQSGGLPRLALWFAPLFGSALFSGARETVGGTGRARKSAPAGRIAMRSAPLLPRLLTDPARSAIA